MKAQERHELRENDLAGWLQYGLWAFIKQNGSYVLLVIALGFLTYQIYGLIQRRAQDKEDSAWQAYYGLPHRESLLAQYIVAVRMRAMVPADADPEVRRRAAAEVDDMEALIRNRPTRLREIIDSNDIKPLQAACYMEMAEHYRKLLMYPEIMQMVNLSRSEVLEKQAVAYQGAIDAVPDDLLTGAQARFGLAGNLEDRGDWDKAADAYKVLTDKNGKFADTPFAEFATARAAKLEERKKAPRLVSMMSSTITPAPLPSPGLSLEPAARPSGPSGLPSLTDFGSLLGNTSSVTTQPATAPASGLNLGNPFGILPMGPQPAPATSQPAPVPAP
jgi:hypothetical protein